MKILIQCVIALIIFAAVFNLTACPSRSEIKKAYNASASIAETTETAAKTLGNLYLQKVISYQLKERLIEKLKFIRDKGLEYQALLDAAFETYGEDLPMSQIEALDKFFNSNLIPTFVEILKEAGVLSEGSGQKVLNAIALLQVAFATIALIYGKLRSNSESWNSMKEVNLQYV